MFVRIIMGIGVFVAIAIIGVFVQLFNRRKLHEERKKIVEYNNDLVAFSNNNDCEIYNKLILNMSETQKLLGEFGFATIRNPIGGYQRNSVPVLTLLFDVQEERKLEYNLCSNYVNLILTSLRITIGDYDSKIKESEKGIRNILVDFYKGFNWLIATPFIILSYLFTGKNLFKSITSRSVKTIWRVISFLIQMVSVTSVIMTIVLGYNDFYMLLITWLGK